TRAWDVAGNPSPVDSVNVAYDTPPSATLLAPAAGEVLPGGVPFPFEWTMDDAEDAASALKATLRVFDGVTWYELLSNETGRTSTTWALPTVLTSDARAVLEVFDSRGGLGSDAVSFVIADLTAPVVTALNADPTSAEVGQAVGITCVATDDYPGPLSFQITVRRDGVTVADFDSAETTFSPTQAGTYDLECVATDASGNPSSPRDSSFRAEEAFPWWIPLVLALIAIIVVVAIVLSRRRRQRGQEEQDSQKESSHAGK
ncbi:MAG: hypothetical protein ACE5JI_19695, partial [Acidobacteriota bacterium]